MTLRENRPVSPDFARNHFSVSTLETILLSLNHLNYSCTIALTYLNRLNYSCTIALTHLKKKLDPLRAQVLAFTAGDKTFLLI